MLIHKVCTCACSYGYAYTYWCKQTETGPKHKVQALQASAAGGSDNLWQKTNAEAAVAVKDEALREVERVQTFLKEVRVRLVRCMQDEFMRLCARRDL